MRAQGLSSTLYALTVIIGGGCYPNFEKQSVKSRVVPGTPVLIEPQGKSCSGMGSAYAWYVEPFH